MFIPLEKVRAPPIVVWEAAFPFCELSLRLGVLAVWLPWPRAFVVTNGTPIDGSPVVVGLDKDGK